MGFFDRLKNVAKGAASKAVGDLERANPAAVYEATIEGALRRVQEHKQAAAGLAAQRDRVAEAVARLEREEAKVRTALADAVASGDEDTALALITHRDQLTSTLEGKRREEADLVAAVEKTTAGLAQLREEVQALKREREVALAQLATAEASVEIAETVSGVSTSAEARGLESVRSSVAALNARAHAGYLDGDGEPVRGRAEALGRKAAEADARAQLAALKRQLAGGSDADEADDPAPPRAVRKL